MPVHDVNTEAIDAYLGRVIGLRAVDFTPLMDQWRTILEEDNRDSALAGLDGYGNPMIGVTYRPDPMAGTRKPIDYSIQPNDNLTSGHYRTLDGPPLAPQGLESRIVTRFGTEWISPAPNEWVTLGTWQDVVSIDGVPFLQAHFQGLNGLPERDLAHVRPKALERARDTLKGFVAAIAQRLKGS